MPCNLSTVTRAVTVESAEPGTNRFRSVLGQRQVATASDDRLAAEAAALDTGSPWTPGPCLGAASSAWRAAPPAGTQLRQLRPQRQSGGEGGGGRRRRGHLLVPHRSARPADPPGLRGPVQQGQPKRPDQGDDLPERRLQDEDQDGHRGRPGPTIIWGWGGGGLRSYVQANQVEDLTRGSPRTAVKDRLFPSSFGAATIDGKIYAMPAETVQPIVLYWNKKVFDKVGAQPPQSWGDIMSLVPKFNDAGVAPISLGGQSRWTNMMWLEFLFDRIGGPEVFQAVFDGEKDAWSNPASIEGLTKAQELIKANGFVKGFLHHRRLQRRPGAAVHRQGRDDAPRHLDLREHVRSRWRLRQRRQPRLHELPGGRGRQGRPDQHRRQPRPVLLDLLQGHRRREGDRQEVLLHRRALRRRGQGVARQRRDPDRQGPDSQLGSSKDADFLQFVYGVASNAKVFAQSWDQALSPTAAEKLLDNIAKLFQLSITPQQFADNMNQVIGQ